MKGQNALIDLRLRGYVPDFCCITLWHRMPVYRWDFDDPENCMENGWCPDVYILPDENVNTLDLRFLRGLNVNMNSFCDAERTLAALDRILHFDPKMAVTLVRYATHDCICIYKKGQPFREVIMDRQEAA